MRHSSTTLAKLAAGLTVGLLAPLLVVMMSAPARTEPAPPAAAACSLTATGGTVTKTIWMGATLRSYNIRVPAGLSGSVPLLVSHHGLNSNAFFQETTTGWSPYADSKKFIVAYPAGSSWGQGWTLTPNSGDSAFVKKMVDQIKATYCVDANRVYAEGGSLGGYMTQRVLCDHESTFAAGVSTISGELTTGCTIDRPVSVGIVNVEGDPLFPTSPQSTDARDAWLERSDCETTGTAVPNQYGANSRVYSCAAGEQVLWRTYAGTSHAYPTGAALTDFHDRVWSFLQAHPKA
ncbi:alpha/beta hydrolase family esterase [Nocardioides speluncae]|uniref:alpha/beta hydrolase family esterase n=1 Tax=Nocardioides speluncae TaxID=2670337 RepID=UPI00137A708B|nr:prolyl oligopeptidase family serine peptidase [Nocardioides speluncae]